VSIIDITSLCEKQNENYTFAAISFKNHNMTSEKSHTTTSKSGDAMSNAYNSFLTFFENNKKAMTIGAAAVLVLVFGGWAYKQFIMAPKEAKAQEAMMDAQYYFEADSFALALNGKGNALGFKQIIDEFGGTKAGKAARFYAGVSALHAGKYQEAIDYLEDFSTKDILLNVRKNGCLGDANAELKKFEDAAAFYQKAVDAAPDNELTAPLYLYRLAKLKEVNKDKKGAIAIYEQLEANFGSSYEGQMAVKEKAKIEAAQ
jgi:tetratricopeptide (TPR) repeat protein